VKSINKERWMIWAAVPVLALVLVMLAVMQYHWSEAVSNATRARMQAGLQTSLMGFRQDFTRELGVLCMEIRTALNDTDARDPRQLSQQIAHWQQTTSHPGLLEHVYLWESNKDDNLLRLDPSDKAPESVPWPANSEPLHKHLQFVFPPENFAGPGPAGMHAHHHGQRDHAGGIQQVDAFLPWAIDQSILVLASPAHRVLPASSGNHTMAVTWIIIQLNRSVLEKEIFPELAQKYFLGQGAQEYEVAVLEKSAAHQRIAYSSVAGLGDSNGRPMDASMPLFGPPSRRGGVPMPDPGFFAPPGQRSENRRSPDHQVHFEPLRLSPDSSGYEVVVKHRRGSLEAAVSEHRRSGLILSFGSLLLVGVTMALILIGAQRARRLARMQMEFVAGVSHELRTPLAVISSAAENIADGVIEDRERVVQYGQSILKQSRQLTQLVEQVLLYASSESAQRRLDIRPVQVVSAVDSALEGTAAIVKSSGFTVDRHFESYLPAVRADFNALVQCLQNLITNAVKYGGENRWLGIRASSALRANGEREILLSVEDRGLGIGRDEIRQIFEPFYRGASAIDAQIHGTGLGLPLARTLIEAMGGKLTAESEPGRGSSFIIHLPVVDGAQTAESPAALGESAKAATDFTS
jgi:signal transduction histidine kinase